MKERGQAGFIAKVAAGAVVIVAIILVIGTWWMGQSAQQATEDAVRSVSSFYLDELTGRREQVVETNLNSSIKNMQSAVGLLTKEDLSNQGHLQAFQARMKKLYNLEKFAFVDEDGTIFTALGTQNNIDEYDFDHKTISGPEISVKDLHSPEKKVVIAEPLNGLTFMGKKLNACFMEMDMQNLIEGLSLKSDSNEATFCNLYTADGVPLTNMVLGGLASEDNLLDALKSANMEKGVSLDTITDDFQQGKAGAVSFTYNGIQETLDYVPVPNTNWMLTYLIRESVITDQIKDISTDLTIRSLIQTLVTALILLTATGIMVAQTRRNARLEVEKETFEAETRVKQEEMEQRIALQEQLLEQEKQRAQQDKMITALASDYRSVYYVDLDADEGVCYQANQALEGAPDVGQRFQFSSLFTEYAEKFVAEQFRERFLESINPDTIRADLEKQLVLSFRYLIKYEGVESYEMMRIAGVRHTDERDDGVVHAVGIGFADVDAETREQMAQSRALSDALAVAEDASRAKTVFLSNMSHEIRTPMNAIIGLDSIALADPDISDTTRGHLEKIGDSARHLLGIINDILDVSRIESGRMVIKSETFSFSKLLEQVNTIISSQCSTKGIAYHCQINGQVDSNYIGDDTKLRQMFINILGNAVKFTPSGGSIDFTIERIAQFAGKSTLRFTMSDTGVGIDKDFLPHIFDTFSQEDSTSASQYGSTGLGLAITKSIIEMMNGTIEVESVKGEGTTFVVTITLTDTEDPGTDFTDVEIEPHEMSVLVIDDDPVACEHAKLVLETVGVSADLAESGEQAIEMVRLRGARRDPYDLILVDWRMPNMDGVETTRQIRSLAGDESAIIFLTAYNWDDVLEEATKAGVDSFLAKPLFAANVIDEFKQAFKKRSASAKNKKRVDLTGRRVLLAEDMAINAEIMATLMKMKQVEVEHAENGKITVDMFAEHEPGYYDAILMDIRMPVMDGLEATAAIRAMDRPDAKSIPIVALTANAFDEDVQKSVQVGLNAHLSKPVEPDNLFETLESLIPG